MPDYREFDWGQKEDEQPQTGLFGDFDWSDETTPGAPEAPQMAPDTIDAVTQAAPSGAPEAPQEPQVQETGPVFPGLSQNMETGAQAGEELGLSPYLTGASYGTGIEQIGEQATASVGEMSLEGRESAKEFYKEEALPTVSATVATLMAPTTGGTSYLVAAGLTGLAAGGGAFAGEAIEQKLKQEGLMSTGKLEEAPKDAWDILERSAWQGGKEAMWSMVPDVILHSLPMARKALMKGAKPAVTIDGEVIDEGRKAIMDVMEDYASKHSLDPDKLVLTSDVVDSAVTEVAENIAANSYLARKTKAIRGVQEEALKEEIAVQVGKYMDPAKGYVKDTMQDNIEHYINSNFDTLNDFGVAGIVKQGIEKAEQTQAAMARSIYKTVGNQMERTEMVSVYKEVELPFLGADGRPMTTMQTVLQEQPAFPVDLTNVREIGYEEMDIYARTNAKPTTEISELIDLPVQTDFNAAAKRLQMLKQKSRGLERSTAEDALTRKLVVDKAIKQLDEAMEGAAGMADEAGITAPDGRTMMELKREADAIWKEKVEDFKNSTITGIIKAAHPKNGAPEKLGQMFMKNETAAQNILKVLEDSKGVLQGAELEKITQAENAIKGSIVQDLFMPFDAMKGAHSLPNTKSLYAKEKELRRMFGDESYDELRKLGQAIDHQQGTGSANYLGFAQRARESGVMMQDIKNLTKGQLAPIIRDTGSTFVFSFGMGKILTSPAMIRQARLMADPKVDMSMKVRVAQMLAHRTYEYQQAVESSLTDDDRERMEGKIQDIEEAKRMRQGQ